MLAQFFKISVVCVVVRGWEGGREREIELLDALRSGARSSHKSQNFGKPAA